jgi:hypothetical protein
MSDKTGKFFDVIAGEPDTKPDTSGSDVDKGQGGEIGGPEPEREIEFEYIEPSAIRIDGDPGEPKRTRTGRIDGRSKQARAARKTESRDIEGLSIKDLLIGIHAFGASITGVEELEIDEAEGKKLGDAVTQLSSIYGHTISPKTAAWVNFASACGVIYGPRFIAYNARMKNEKAAKPGPVGVPPNKTGPAPAGRPTPLPGGPMNNTTAPRFPNPTEVWNEALEGW